MSRSPKEKGSVNMENEDVLMLEFLKILDKFFRHDVRIPKFISDSYYNVYEEWERKVEQILFSYNLYDTNIVRLLIVVEFEGYALFWWNQFQKDVQKGKEQPIKTWV